MLTVIFLNSTNSDRFFPSYTTVRESTHFLKYLKITVLTTADWQYLFLMITRNLTMKILRYTQPSFQFPAQLNYCRGTGTCSESSQLQIFFKCSSITYWIYLVSEASTILYRNLHKALGIDSNLEIAHVNKTNKEKT